MKYSTMKKGIYKHYKWTLYEVIWIALHTETREELVLYTALYDTDYEYFVRPKPMFCEEVKIDWKMKKRFEYIWNKRYT